MAGVKIDPMDAKPSTNDRSTGVRRVRTYDGHPEVRPSPRVAGRQGLALSGADLANASQLGSMWWLFAIGGFLSFGGALATLGSLKQRLAGSPS